MNQDDKDVEPFDPKLVRNENRAPMSTPQVVVIIQSSTRQARSERADHITKKDVKPSRCDMHEPK